MAVKSKAEKARILGEETTTVQLALVQANLALKKLLPIIHHTEYYEGVIHTLETIHTDISQLQNTELEMLYAKATEKRG